jgi:hypothetical protein
MSNKTNILQQLYTLIVRKKTIPPLGRWTIYTCDKKTNTKIDFSNEDHCGPCGNQPLLPLPPPIPEKIPFYKKETV